MRISLDIQSATANVTGVGHYTRLLARHLALTNPGHDLRFTFFDFKRRGAPFQVTGADTKPLTWCPGRAAQAAWKRLGWPPFDWLFGDADLYHFPNFLVPPLRRGGAVATVHDLTFMRYPEFCEDRNQRYLARSIRDTVARADAVITVSRFTAAEMEDLLGANPAKLFPVHHGISRAFRSLPRDEISDGRRAKGLDRPYLLSVGTLEPRKNYRFLIEVFEQLSDFDGQLVIAGMKGWKYEPILERMETSSRRDDIRYLEYVPTEDLPVLYAGAECFVFPSHYEGFGFPPLEAMACGTPVVSSGGGSLPEVVGDAAWIPVALDIDAWVQGIRKILHDADIRRKLQASGLAQARKYTWAESARKTWEVYEAVHGRAEARSS